MYLVPPMDDEPPPEFVAFVADHLASLRAETNRLVGGDTEAQHLYLEVLADVAGHWRRLCWKSRLAHRDVPREYLERRLSARTRQWREDQVYEVDVRVLRPPTMYAPLATAAASGSLALRKAAVLPSTTRGGVVAVADAGIAWVQAYRRHQWHRVGRLAASGILLIAGMIQYFSWLATLTD
ncbi:MAG: hypothetical protein ABW046_16295 [Actinoplanes sp.]